MSTGDRFIVFVAKGFGSGYAPKGPGTFGSIVGLAFVALLLLLPGPLSYTTAAVSGIIASVWFCGEAERILNLKDPGSIVLDEIIALPICFLPFVWETYLATGQIPTPASLFVDNWLLVGAAFVGFRFFDILKPWPIKQLQDLHGGFGVTIDDVLAGIYVAALLWFFA